MTQDILSQILLFSSFASLPPSYPKSLAQFLDPQSKRVTLLTYITTSASVACEDLVTVPITHSHPTRIFYYPAPSSA